MFLGQQKLFACDKLEKMYKVIERFVSCRNECLHNVYIIVYVLARNRRKHLWRKGSVDLHGSPLSRDFFYILTNYKQRTVVPYIKAWKNSKKLIKSNDLTCRGNF
jgi:hypothetical protein